MSARLLVRHPPGRGAERRYAYEMLLSEFLGLEIELMAEDRPNVEIGLAGDPAGARLEVADVLFATPPDRWLTAASLPTRPLARASVGGLVGVPPRAVLGPLPVLYGEGRHVECSGSVCRLGIDVFGSSFFLLTRYEEIISGARDEHDRFAAAGSLAAEEQLFERPLVNEYVELLWTLLERLWPRLTRRPRRFSVLPSHDVDLPLCRIPLAHAGRLALRDLRREHGPVVAARRLATAALGGRLAPRYDLYNTFDWIMARSETMGLRSAFFFMAGNTAGAIDNDYRLDEPWVGALLREIHERGHEIGLHPSYETYRDAESTRAELEALQAACTRAGVEQERWGGRQHYLRWRNPDTWRNWEDAGLDYDSSLGFADRAGFRSGVCYEHPVFDLRRRRPLRLRERPLVAMEASLLEYQRLSLEGAAAEIERLGEIVRRFDGQLTLLWHNDRLLSRRARRAYGRALGHATRGGGARAPRRQGQIQPVPSFGSENQARAKWAR